MFIRMLATRTGSEDGHIVRIYHHHSYYEVGDTLAKSFILSGWAIEIPSVPIHEITNS